MKELSLSSTRWESASVGWYIPSFNGVLDPEGEWLKPLVVSKKECSEGLYAHAPSLYKYSLDGLWKNLSVRHGLQDGHRGSVVFAILLDGKEVYRSALTTLADGDISVDLDIADARMIEFVTEQGDDGGSSDWGIWLEPTLSR